MNMDATLDLSPKTIDQDLGHVAPSMSNGGVQVQVHVDVNVDADALVRPVT